MSFEIEGKLLKIFPTESKTASFQAREFVLEIESGNYPQVIKFQLTQDKCAVLDNYAEGQQAKVHFDLRGREWNGKYLTNLNAWRIENSTGSNSGSSVPSNSMPQSEPPATNSSFPDFGSEPVMPSNNLDDLPF